MVRFEQSSGIIKCPDGATLSYQVHGASGAASGVPIVLHSGATHLVQDWGLLPGKIAEHAGQQVITYDPRGFGSSTLSPEGVEKISLETYADDLLTLLRTLSVPVADLMGWSMGGWVLGTLLGSPSTTVDPTNGFQVGTGLVVRQALFAATCLAMTEAVASSAMGTVTAGGANPDVTLSPMGQWSKTSHAMVRTFYPSGYTEQSEENRERYNSVVQSYLSTPQQRPLDIILKQSVLLVPGSVDVEPGLKALPPHAQARIGILSGPDDLLISSADTEAMYAALPFARTVRLPLSANGVAGHMFWHCGSLDDWASNIAHFFHQGERLSGSSK